MVVLIPTFLECEKKAEQAKEEGGRFDLGFGNLLQLCLEMETNKVEVALNW